MGRAANQRPSQSRYKHTKTLLALDFSQAMVRKYSVRPIPAWFKRMLWCAFLNLLFALTQSPSNLLCRCRRLDGALLDFGRFPVGFPLFVFPSVQIKNSRLPPGDDVSEDQASVATRRRQKQDGRRVTTSCFQWARINGRYGIGPE